ncbi:MAG: bifunctional 3-(3-hydroxy-phenyl)propionate/3-hydroxycinnamic acid hydroxylase, partial [Proteobacteria bacterium]|nr:bifunctional 3-(3-hydroxy-phenyl)propionate/3-hydroxycinnamic acid hydroxylase [Pseudomonadota bacterium]
MIDVAIVGCGPVGALLANLLGPSGLAVEVFEREAEVWRLPRAVHFDGEVMRIFQATGLAAEVGTIAREGTRGMHFVNAEGRTLLVRGIAEGPGPQGWATSWYFHQPDLERVLRAGLARYPNVRLHLQHEVLEIEQDASGARLQVGGPGGHAARTTRYVVGCDGARSMLRRLIGGGDHDLGLHQPWLVADLLLKRDLGLPSWTVQHCNPARPMTEVCVTGRRRRWEIMLMPGDDPQGITAPERVWDFIGARITPADAELERAALYTFHSVIARRWRDQRLLIAGDAAHQTPPFLGQGMCAGIRDAANLAWKFADEALLDSYQSEREPHVRVFIEEALRLGSILQTTDPQVAEARDRRFLESGKEEMINLSPPLGPGFHAGGGDIFPQPVLPDGRRLDEAIGGYCFAVLCPKSFSIDTGLKVIPFEAPEAIVLRPDRYVYGQARSSKELQQLLG